MVPSRLPAVAAGFILVLLVAPLVLAPAAAAPPPRPVCAACGETLEERAGEAGLGLTVTNSTATVVVSENGTATWVVRNRLRGSDAVDRLRENGTLRRQVADPRYWEAELRSATVTDDAVLTARYRHDAFATSAAGGTLRSTAFSERYGYRNLQGLGAERLVVVAPPNTEIRSSVPGGTASENRSRLTLTSFEGGGFVTFVPEDRTAGAVWGWLAVAELVWPSLLGNGFVGVLVPAAVAGLAVAAGGRFFRAHGPFDDRVRSDLDRLLVGSGAVAVLAALLGGALVIAGPSTVVLFGFGTGLLVLGVVVALVPVDRVAFRHLAAGATLGAGVSVTAAVLGAPLFHGRVPWTGITAGLRPVVAAFAFAPAGFALARDDTGRAVIAATAGVGVTAVFGVSLLAPVRVVPLPVRLLASAGQAVGLTLVGLPFLLVGAALGRGSRSRPREPT